MKDTECFDGIDEDNYEIIEILEKYLIRKIITNYFKLVDIKLLMTVIPLKRVTK